MVGNPIIKLTTNFLTKLWKEVIEYGVRFVNYAKTEPRRIVAKVL